MRTKYEAELLCIYTAHNDNLSYGNASNRFSKDLVSLIRSRLTQVKVRSSSVLLFLKDQTNLLNASIKTSDWSNI